MSLCRSSSAFHLTEQDIHRGVTDLIAIRDSRTFGLELEVGRGHLSPAQRKAHE
jgi:hypothetical protein